MSCVALLTVLGSAPARADEAAIIAAAKADVGFSSWPGQGGPLKKGLEFAVADHPALAGFSVVRDELDASQAALGIVRKLRMTRGSEHLNIVIGTAHGSTDNGHELFFRSEIFLSEMGVLARFQRGDGGGGINVGDLNFELHGTTSSDVQGYIAFLRNNVFCVIHDGRPSNPSTVDAKQLAADLDAQVTALADLTPAGFDALRPTISTFAPASSTLVAQEGSSTTLTISLSDPSAEAVTKLLDGHGSLQLNTSVDPPTVRSTHVTGALPIDLTAVNESLQFSSAQTTITVTP